MPTGDIVLVLTGVADPTADAVITALAAHPVRVARIDTGDFPVNMRLSAANHGKGWTGQLRTDHVTVELERVRSVYYRRPTQFTFPAGMSQADRAYGCAEARVGLGGVLSALDCLYVNHPHTAARAEYKPLQQTVAARAGLADAFAASAHCLQAWVDKACDARVTMVGRRPYGVAIHDGSPAAHVDWRADYGALRYSPIQPPAEVTTAMGRYLDLFGLSFGAFDFGITHDGQWLAYECNPNGQWLWLEQRTNIGISAALAELLAAGVGE
ncbi:MAG: hypothetical protein JO115_23000 [Pseudonocardiales bacterium]|nr:hypothetical protein [Pseudonocardiales bacterium]